jgi:hypothetical protein
MPRNRLADYWTLTRLAAAMGVSTQALRQRVERGTMKATKVGATWLVAPAEAERMIARREAQQ